ncbi:MAG: phosphoglycerate dehydrogenase [Gammaproteobacteria bacterium]|nr:phosphoglycerate dehydrogenase [Gammaproteobacteria bacterium]MYD01362.1 phosphoglycerate dehydrogenase [Gammaproteobacteria bacterium]MYI24682.1 phosphoglycerate dehydrogenase [Gammaproteobacteria bacterium]
MFNIRIYNSIANEGLARLPAERFKAPSGSDSPDGILLRSHDLHSETIPDSVEVVARAGAGVNNIPVDALAKRGIPVLNAPGANANAVKELVVAGMLMAARNLLPAWDHLRAMDLPADELRKTVEAHKKRFAGRELADRVMGVVGLGAVGVKVANAAIGMGMKVFGYDRALALDRAWELSSQVGKGQSLKHVFAGADFVSVHVPLMDETRGLVGGALISSMRKGGVLLNFARGGIVDSGAVIEALNSGWLSAYVCDFPEPELMGHPGAILLPHLGASTSEAEVNCAVIAAENLRAYLEDGNVRGSVNFPVIDQLRGGGFRLTIANENVPWIVARVSAVLAQENLNIESMMNMSRGRLAYTMLDLNDQAPDPVLKRLRGMEGILRVRDLGARS